MYLGSRKIGVVSKYMRLEGFWPGGYQLTVLKGGGLMSRSTSVSGHINLLTPGSVRLYKVGAVVLVRVCPDP